MKKSSSPHRNNRDTALEVSSQRDANFFLSLDHQQGTVLRNSLSSTLPTVYSIMCTWISLLS